MLILDLEGWGLKNFDSKVSTALAEIAKPFYPDYMGVCIFYFFSLLNLRKFFAHIFVNPANLHCQLLLGYMGRVETCKNAFRSKDTRKSINCHVLYSLNEIIDF